MQNFTPNVRCSICSCAWWVTWVWTFVLQVRPCLPTLREKRTAESINWRVIADSVQGAHQYLDQSSRTRTSSLKDSVPDEDMFFQGRSALEPLLRILVKVAVDDADLSTRIKCLFKVWVLRRARNLNLTFCCMSFHSFRCKWISINSKGMILWQVLDSDGSGGLSCTEFCHAMRKLVSFSFPKWM